MTDLHRAVIKSKKVYESCLAKHVKFVKVEANKKFLTPSLDYQKTGACMQDSVPFKRSQACPSKCPGRGHFNTMALVRQIDMNAGNQQGMQHWQLGVTKCFRGNWLLLDATASKMAARG